MIKSIFLVLILLLVISYLSFSREGFSSSSYHLNKKVNSTIRYIKTKKNEFIKKIFKYPLLIWPKKQKKK
jgi:hypothetical protein